MEQENTKSEEEAKQIFWLDKWEGSAQGGYYVRNPLKEFFKVLEDKGMKPVGISFDGSYNLEIIIETKEDAGREA